MKYPKEWLEAAKVGCFSDHRTEAVQILDRLAEVGALKEPPKPREFWLCTQCGRYARMGELEVFPGKCVDGTAHTTFGPKGKDFQIMIRVREVVENDDE